MTFEDMSGKFLILPKLPIAGRRSVWTTGQLRIHLTISVRSFCTTVVYASHVYMHTRLLRGTKGTSVCASRTFGTCFSVERYVESNFFRTLLSQPVTFIL
jgi:hypothetical protein